MRVAIVGAGISGLAAARALGERDVEVVVLEKARRPGGRLATAELAGGARADIGAQFFTVRSARFEAAVGDWVDEGLAHVWCRGFSGDQDGHPRYAVAGGMRRLAEALARGVRVELSTHVTAVTPSADGWTVSWPQAHGHGAGALSAHAVLLTAPREQSAALVAPLPVPGCEYSATAALALELDGPPRIAAPGGERTDPQSGWSWVADNVAKGASERPSTTLHSTAEVGRAALGRPGEELLAELIVAAGPWIAGREVLDARLHRWRYATPKTIDPAPFIELAPGLFVAGDAFAGPRVEGAFLSGRAVADQLGAA